MFERLPAFQAAQSPNGVAVVTTEHDYTFTELSLGAIKAAHLLRRSGVKAGQRVVIQTSHAFVHWILTFGVEALGATSCSLPYIAEWAPAMQYVGADVLIVDGPPPGDPGVPCILADQAWLEQIEGQPSDPIAPAARSPQDPIRIVVTSGSTGLPKKIMLTREMLDRRITLAAISQVFADRHPRVISPIGEGSIAGVMMALTAWMVGGALCQYDPRKSWVANLNDGKVEGLAVAPMHLKMVLDSLPEAFTLLKPPAVFIAGGSLSKPLAEATQRRLSQNIIVGFGATETGSVTQGHIGLLSGAEDSAGFIQPWAEVEIVGPKGESLGDGQLGEIRIRGAHVIEGYLDEPASEFFRDGWFYPRDLGLIQHGVLKVVGRADDLMHLGGAKLLPSRLEELVLGLDEVLDAAAFARPGPDGLDEPWMAISPRDGCAWTEVEARVRARLSSVEDRVKLKVRLQRVQEIPRNALGKIERHKLIAQFADQPR